MASARIVERDWRRSACTIILKDFALRGSRENSPVAGSTEGGQLQQKTRPIQSIRTMRKIYSFRGALSQDAKELLREGGSLNTYQTETRWQTDCHH